MTSAEWLHAVRRLEDALCAELIDDDTNPEELDTVREIATATMDMLDLAEAIIVMRRRR
jgi:hypothetical protein